MRVTLKDIATALGISTATASRALSGRGRIRPSTRKAVIAKALELGYELPPELAITERTVGIVFDHRLQSLAADPFYSIVMAGVEKECKQHNCQVLFHTKEQDSDQRLSLLFRKGRLHGLIVVGGDIQEDFVEKLRSFNIPFVLVDNSLEGADCVVSDNMGGVQKALHHLFQLGHEKIGFVGGPLTHSSLAERYQAYRTTLDSQGFASKPEWSWIHSEPGPSADQGYQAIQTWAGRGLEVTALVTDNDSTAVGVLRGCRERGIQVPEELSIVGFDNDINLAEHIAPGISSVHVDKVKMGEWAAKRILELMEKRDVPVKIILSTQLVVRGTSGAARL